MASITALRAMINNGWTIANRRNLISSIGKNNFDEIVLNARKLNMTGDVCEFQFVKGHLTPETITRTKASLLDKVKLLSSRWENPITDYTATVVANSEIPMHHFVSGSNHRIRLATRCLNIESPNAKQLRHIEYTLPEIQAIDEAFSKLPQLEKDCIVYRGRVEQFAKSLNADFDVINNAKVGDKIIPDTGYSYCGIEKSLAEYWGRSVLEEAKTIMYTIRLPKGAKVSRNLEHGGEVLMPRGAEYKVISKEINGNHTDVTLEYILPKKDNLQEVNDLMARYNLKPESYNELFG